MTQTQATQFIRDQATEEDLGFLRTLLNQRKALLRTVEAALIRPGARVTLRNIRPGYLSGLTGTVSALEPGTKAVLVATVQLDEASAQKVRRSSRGRYTSSVPGIPVSALSPR